MSSQEPVSIPAVKEHVRASPRALVLVVLSRILLLVLALALARSAIIVGTGSVSHAMVLGVPVVETGEHPGIRTGSTVSELVGEVLQRIADEDAHMVELEVSRTRGALVSVRLAVDLLDRPLTAVEQLVQGLTGELLSNPSPQSVDQSARGVRVVLNAHATLAISTPADRPHDMRPTAVVLSETVEMVGASLRSMDVPAREHEPVRLAVSASLSQLIELIAEIEDRQSSPLLFQHVLIRQVAPHIFEARLVFALRAEDALLSEEVA